MLFGLHVAETVGRGIVEPTIIDARVIFGALTGAISLADHRPTWYYGIPSSSSHALIGGLVGAGMAKAGSAAWSGTGVIKTVSGIVLRPMPDV